MIKNAHVKPVKHMSLVSFGHWSFWLFVIYKHHKIRGKCQKPVTIQYSSTVVLVLACAMGMERARGLHGGVTSRHVITRQIDGSSDWKL